MQKRVFVIGQFEHENFGDLLMARIYMERILRSGLIPHFIAENHIPLAKHVCDRQVIFTPKVAEESFSKDYLLLAGGGYLSPPTFNRRSWAKANLSRSSLWVAEKLAHSASLSIAHSLELGDTGSSPLNSAIGKLLSAMHHVSVRNNESLKYASRLGIQAKRSADCVQEWITERDWPLSSCGTIGVHVTKKLFSDRSPISALIRRRLLKLCLGDEVHHVRLIEDQPVDGRPKQLANLFSEQLRQSGKNVEYIGFLGLDGVLNAAASVDVLYTTKLHLGVVTHSVGNTAVWLHDNEKSVRFAVEHGVRSNCHRFHALGGLLFAIAGKPYRNRKIYNRNVQCQVNFGTLESLWATHEY